MQVYKFGDRLAVRYPPSERWERPAYLPPDGSIGTVIVGGYDPVVSFAAPPCTLTCDYEWVSLAILATGDPS
jgi:hypothetical protein